MRLVLSALLAVLVAGHVPSVAFARSQEARAEIECPTCKGKGKAQVECAGCFGTGAIACPSCVPKRVPLRAFEADETTSDEKLLDLRRVGRELEDKLAAIPGPKPPRPGWWRCPSGATGMGSIFPQKCKFCDGNDVVPCPTCESKANVTCGACKGKRTLERSCADCGGSGRLPDPASISSEARQVCSWCLDGTRACSDCKKGEENAICGPCNGSKRSVCGACIGRGSSPCSKCSGIGVLRGDGKDCPDCKSGTVKCTACRDGKLECSTCKGTGKARASCWTCRGNRLRPCPGCFRGAFRHWLVVAEMLANADAERSIASLEIARDRIGPYFERRAKLFAETDEERAAMDGERSAAAKRVDDRITELREPVR
jgi:hypothetical protein